MARIRTLKPEFFRHEELFDLEQESGLPVRLAYAGLWTACDRKGRFKWRPRALKSEILPYDDVDFSRVLDALASRGFCVRYVSEGESYGYVPTFLDHQYINNRESESTIPEPLPNLIVDASSTREPRVSHAPLGEGVVGRSSRKESDASKTRRADMQKIEDIYFAYPRRVAKTAALKAIEKASRSVPLDILLARTQQFAEQVRREHKEVEFIPHPATWFNQGRYEDEGLKVPEPKPFKTLTWEEFNALEAKGEV